MAKGVRAKVSPLAGKKRKHEVVTRGQALDCNGKVSKSGGGQKPNKASESEAKWRKWDDGTTGEWNERGGTSNQYLDCSADQLKRRSIQAQPKGIFLFSYYVDGYIIMYER